MRLLSIPRNSSALIRQNRKLITVFTKHTTELLPSDSWTESPPTLKPHIPKMHYFDTQMYLCSVLNWFSGCWLRRQTRLQRMYSMKQYTDFTTALLTFKLPVKSIQVKVISFTSIRKSKAFSAPIFTNSCQSPVHNFIQIGRNCWIHGKFSFALRDVGFHYIELHETHNCS